MSIIAAGIFQSRVAVLTLVASTTCFFTLSRPKHALIGGTVVLLATVLIDGSLGFPLVERFVQHWDGSGRIPLWLSAWRMFLDAPLLGHGPHTFVVLYKSYLTHLAFPEWLFVDSRVVPWPHNLYLEILSEQGFLGLLALGILLFGGFLSRQKLRAVVQHETRFLGYGAYAGLVGFCVAAIFELTFLRQWVVIMLFLLLGVIAQLLLVQGNTKGVDL